MDKDNWIIHSCNIHSRDGSNWHNRVFLSTKGRRNTNDFRSSTTILDVASYYTRRVYYDSVDPFGITTCQLCVGSLSAVATTVDKKCRGLTLLPTSTFQQMFYFESASSDLLFLSTCLSKNSHDTISSNMCHFILTCII